MRSVIPKPLVFAGRELSAGIYYWHIMLLALISMAAVPIQDSSAWQIVKPLAVITVSLCFSLILRRVFDAVASK